MSQWGASTVPFSNRSFHSNLSCGEESPVDLLTVPHPMLCKPLAGAATGRQPCIQNRAQGMWEVIGPTQQNKWRLRAALSRSSYLQAWELASNAQYLLKKEKTRNGCNLGIERERDLRIYWSAYLAKMATFLFSEKIIWERVIRDTVHPSLTAMWAHVGVYPQSHVLAQHITPHTQKGKMRKNLTLIFNVSKVGILL